MNRHVAHLLRPLQKGGSDASSQGDGAKYWNSEPLRRRRRCRHAVLQRSLITRWRQSATTAMRSTTDVSAQCSRWWRRRELKSSVEGNNFSRSCVVRHKYTVNKGVRACLNLLSLDCHHAPKRTKRPIVCPVLSRPRSGAGGGLAPAETSLGDGFVTAEILYKRATSISPTCRRSVCV